LLPFVLQLYSQQKGQHKFWFHADYGTVQEAVLLHPSPSEVNVTEEYDPLGHIRQYYQIPIVPSIDNLAIAVAHFYNSFQKEREYADAVAFENTRELKFSVDFSSILGVPEGEDKEKPLFKDSLAVYLMNGEKKIKVVKKFDDIERKIFSVTYNNIQKSQSLRLEWSTNWDNLATSQVYNNKPGNIITKHENQHIEFRPLF
jgi:hypothetical protein